MHAAHNRTICRFNRVLILEPYFYALGAGKADGKIFAIEGMDADWTILVIHGNNPSPRSLPDGDGISNLFGARGCHRIVNTCRYELRLQYLREI